MSKIVYNSIMVVIMMSFVTLAVLLVLTPERTSYGDYTSFVKYWTSDAYLEANFAPVKRKI